MLWTLKNNNRTVLLRSQTKQSTKHYNHNNQCLMPLAILSLLLLYLGAFCQGTIGLIVNSTESYGNFVVTRILPDGEIQRIIRWRGICAKETIVDWGDTSVALREVEIRGKKLQLIYEGDSLTDCVDERSIDQDICRYHDQIWSIDIKEKFQVFDDHDVTTLPSEIWWLQSTGELDRKCHRVKSQTRNQVLRQRLAHRRVERGLQNMFIAPGTKWCGPHQIASSYKQLGALDSLDRCCRRHDHCCRSIPPFSERYNFWNYMPFTLSHCGCDQSFRTCLKMAGTSAANFIGRIFFNVVQTKCFVLKPQKVCTKSTWWGKCEKHEYKKQAHLRNNIAY